MAGSPCSMMDVARRAGVSQPTVSYVLRGRCRAKGIRPETSQRVLRAAAELNYRPNRLAQGLVSGRSGLQGLILPDHTRHAYDPYIGVISSAFIAELSQHNYRCVTAFLGARPGKEQECLELFDERLIDAMVLVGLVRADQPLLDYLAKEELPAVLLNSRDEHGKIPHVGEDIHAAMGQVLDHLTGLGRRRPCYLTIPRDTTVHMDRLAEFEAACKQRRAQLAAFHVIRSVDASAEVQAQARAKVQRHDMLSVALRYRLPESVVPGYVGVMEMLRLPERPDAIVAMNDWMALGALLAVQDAGLRIPDDISLIGWDNLEWTGHIRPALTTVDVGSEAIAREAARLSLSFVRGDKGVKVPSCKVPGALIIRGTCGGVASSHPSPLI